MCGTLSHPVALDTSRDAAQRPPQAASLSTARAAAEDECFRAVVDLQEVARKLNDNKWEKNLALLDKVADCDKALSVPGHKALSMFDPTTWCTCFSEWWFGDCLPNDRIAQDHI